MESLQIIQLRKTILDKSKPGEERERARKELLKILEQKESGDNGTTNA